MSPVSNSCCEDPLLRNRCCFPRSSEAQPHRPNLNDYPTRSSPFELDPVEVEEHAEKVQFRQATPKGASRCRAN